MFYAIAAVVQSLTVREILTDIPHDAGAVITVLIVALFVGFVWHGSRGGGGDKGAPGV